MRVMFQGALQRTNSDLRTLKPGDQAVYIEMLGSPPQSSTKPRPFLGANTIFSVKPVKIVDVQGHKHDTIGGKSVPLPGHQLSNTPSDMDEVDKVTIQEEDGQEKTFLYGRHTVWLNEDNSPMSSAIPETTYYPSPSGSVRILPVKTFLETPVGRLFYQA